MKLSLRLTVHIVTIFALILIIPNGLGSIYATPKNNNSKSIEQNIKLLVEGAGKSEKTPRGLEHASGIDKKLAGTKYWTRQLTNNSEDDLYSRINYNGQVVWGSFNNSGAGDIYLYDEGKIIQITHDSGNWFPQINNPGDITWMHFDGTDSEIYLYVAESENIVQVTNNDFNDTFDWSNSYPIKTFNDNREIVWRGGANPVDNEIYLYNDGTIDQITNNSLYDHLPRLNEAGQIVWIGGKQVYFYDGGDIKQITLSGYLKDEPSINDDGDLVWMDWVDGAMNSEIYYYNYSTSSITRITNNNNTDTNPKINNQGHVIWESWINENPNDREIFYYDGTDITQLTDTQGPEQKSYLNNVGLSIWENPSTPPENDFELFTHELGSTENIQLTDNIYNDAFPYLNDNNQIVWQGFDGNDFEIFLATPLP